MCVASEIPEDTVSQQTLIFGLLQSLQLLFQNVPQAIQDTFIVDESIGVWALQLCISISWGFLESSLSVAKKNFLMRGKDYTYQDIRINIQHVVRSYAGLVKWQYGFPSRNHGFTSTKQLASQVSRTRNGSHLVEQALRPIRELLVTPKAWVSLLHSQGYCVMGFFFLSWFICLNQVGLLVASPSGSFHGVFWYHKSPQGRNIPAQVPLGSVSCVRGVFSNDVPSISGGQPRTIAKQLVIVWESLGQP